MRLRYLGKETQGGGSPTLFATDRDSYVVQGWRVSDDDASVEIPKKLLDHLDHGGRLHAALYDTGRGTYILSGDLVTDEEALSQMSIPNHETCVEIKQR